MVYDKTTRSVPTEILLASKLKNFLSKPEHLTSRSALKQYDEVFLEEI